MNNRLTRAIMAFVVTLQVFVSAFVALPVAFAAGETTDVVIHKLAIRDLTGWPKTANADGTYTGVDKTTKYDGSAIENITGYFGDGTEEINGVRFTYWKISEEQYKTMTATPTSYDTVAKVEAYFNTDTTAKDSKTEVGPTANNQGVTVTKLADGFYWFVEDMGSVLENGRTLAKAAAIPFGLALPAFKADGTRFGNGDKALHVYPKNTVANQPKIDKDFGENFGKDNAHPNGVGQVNPDSPRNDKSTPVSATVGDKVPYIVRTKIPAQAQYQTAIWADRMTEGLTYNDDLVVRVGNETLTADTDYKVVKDKDNRGFSVTFTAAGLEKINNKDAEVTVDLVYSATLNKDAIVDVPESNDVTFHYGNNPTNDNLPKPNTPQPQKPSNKQITVTKKWDADADGAEDAQWPAGLTVRVALYDAQTGVIAKDAVELNSTTQSHTWTDLKDDVEYKVVEETYAAGYYPVYKVTADGETTITNVKNNNPQPLTPTEPKVVTGGKRFQKVDENTKAGLAGAVFYVKNADNKYLAKKADSDVAQDQAAYVAAEKAYQEAVKNSGDVATTKAARDAAYVAVETHWKWQDDAAGAYEVTSGEDGYFKVTGLAYGTYKLEEKTAPEGYAKLTADLEFMVAQGSHEAATLAGAAVTDTGLQAITNRKITIPQTGGMGTVLFIAVGSLMMGMALIAMKKKHAEN